MHNTPSVLLFIITLLFHHHLRWTTAQAEINHISCAWIKVMGNQEETHYSFLHLPSSSPSSSVRLYHSVWSTERRAPLGCAWSDDAAVIERYRSLCGAERSGETPGEFIQQHHEPFDLSLMFSPDGGESGDGMCVESTASPTAAGREEVEGRPGQRLAGQEEGRPGQRLARSVGDMMKNDHNNHGLIVGHRRVKRGFIVPGTLWCGSGNKAPSYADLGVFAGTDSCCREHDQCKDTILSFHSSYGVFNSNIFTMSHCDCDKKFHSCLAGANDSISGVVGHVFFNVLKLNCFEFSHRLQCTQRNWFGMCKENKVAPYAVVHQATPYGEEENGNDTNTHMDLNTNTHTMDVSISTVINNTNSHTMDINISTLISASLVSTQGQVTAEPPEENSGTASSQPGTGVSLSERNSAPSGSTSPTPIIMSTTPVMMTSAERLDAVSIRDHSVVSPTSPAAPTVRLSEVSVANGRTRSQSQQDTSAHTGKPLPCDVFEDLDGCKFKIFPQQRKYGLHNQEPRTLYHCNCTARFHSCLAGANDSISGVVGHVFFNVLKLNCFEFSHRLQCTQRNWFGMCKENKVAPYAVVHQATPYGEEENGNDTNTHMDLNTNTHTMDVSISTVINNTNSHTMDINISTLISASLVSTQGQVTAEPPEENSGTASSQPGTGVSLSERNSASSGSTSPAPIIMSTTPVMMTSTDDLDTVSIRDHSVVSPTSPAAPTVRLSVANGRTRSQSQQDTSTNKGQPLPCDVFEDLDGCKFKIFPQQRKYGLHNQEPRTLYHCNCTARLFQSLAGQEQITATQTQTLDYVSRSCFFTREDCTHGKTCTAAVVKSAALLPQLMKQQLGGVVVEAGRPLEAIRLKVRRQQNNNSRRAKRKDRPVRLRKLCVRMNNKQPNRNTKVHSTEGDR